METRYLSMSQHTTRGQKKNKKVNFFSQYGDKTEKVF